MTTGPPISVVGSVAVAIWIAFQFPPEYHYLKYVDLGQFTKQVGKFLLESFGMCLFVVALSFIFHWDDASTHDSFIDSIINAVPIFIWFIVLTGVLTWILRGQSIQFPKLNVKQWLVINLMIAAAAGTLVLVEPYLSHVVSACLAMVMWVAFESYKKLIEIGRMNYKLRQMLINAQRGAVEDPTLPVTDKTEATRPKV